MNEGRDDFPAVFEPEREVVTFRCREECADTLHYVLDHENERRSIASTGEKRCPRDHRSGARILTFTDEALDKLRMAA